MQTGLWFWDWHYIIRMGMGKICQPYFILLLIHCKHVRVKLSKCLFRVKLPWEILPRVILSWIILPKLMFQNGLTIQVTDAISIQVPEPVQVSIQTSVPVPIPVQVQTNKLETILKTLILKLFWGHLMSTFGNQQRSKLKNLNYSIEMSWRSAKSVKGQEVLSKVNSQSQAIQDNLKVIQR